MKNYKHFVITLFNLQFGNTEEKRNYWHKDKRGISTQTEAWLQKRFELFDRYCFPSMRGQTTPDFIWLCLFDSNTPDVYKSKIEKYKEQMPQFCPLFFSAEEAEEFNCSDEKERVRFIRRAVASFLTKEDMYVITTNLDNDDCFHKDTLKTIQRYFLDSPREVLYSMNLGLQYFVKRKAFLKCVILIIIFYLLSNEQIRIFGRLSFMDTLLPVKSWKRPIFLKCLIGLRSFTIRMSVTSYVLPAVYGIRFR